MEPARLQDVIHDAFTTLEHEHPGAYHTVELMCHPGYPGIDPASGCGVGADAFSMSDERRHEMNVLTGRAMKQFYAQSHIQIVDDFLKKYGNPSKYGRISCLQHEWVSIDGMRIKAKWQHNSEQMEQEQS
ncbi:hypothetical protein CAPTEDRAFT_209969 [Capitella teleta]|uniref:Carbohydrate deacetylase n=1 Tax=Capitella teleta TaxID=283909 RepID=R7UDF7_CAPTE|nr:hypothetical protein CAPTEDRAFT_209969 [Capitella teleta]|eukprot:ELU04004.1 hypothetical protein CAPTEDRAFT_209969 [Capitella teleta]